VAHTDFRLLSTFSEGLLVEARPRTGRKHQIRAHLAAQGLPILGDERYSSAVRAGAGSPRPMLHALRLELRHPVSGEPLVLECPYPEDFQTALDGLRQS
jgi:23S rRNA-/tRNA-specific pseudouridylate synthase